MCTIPKGKPGEWTMCCHLFQCLALVHLQTLQEAPGPCTAVAERQACNPSPAVGLEAFQKGLNSQLRLNSPLFATCLLHECDNQILQFVYQWHHWTKYFHDWCPEIQCDPFFPHKERARGASCRRHLLQKDRQLAPEGRFCDGGGEPDTSDRRADWEKRDGADETCSYSH